MERGPSGQAGHYPSSHLQHWPHWVSSNLPDLGLDETVIVDKPGAHFLGEGAGLKELEFGGSPERLGSYLQISSQALPHPMPTEPPVQSWVSGQLLCVHCQLHASRLCISHFFQPSLPGRSLRQREASPWY